MRIEDYALIGDTETAALVSKSGSIDWLCMPRFDSSACFAALLGSEDHGRWQIAPAAGSIAVRRRYHAGTLVLQTEFATDTGRVCVTDCMPVRDNAANVVRIVEGLEGSVAMRMELVIRFDYGTIVPWLRRLDGTLLAIGGPDALMLTTPVPTRGKDFTTIAEFVVRAGEKVPFVLTWFPSNHDAPAPVDAERSVARTAAWWRKWSGRCVYEGPYREAVLSSLVVLKSLTYKPTGGIIAAPTTSVPEFVGGVRNWDYRYCWLRDATFTLAALLATGYREEAVAFRDWLLRSAAGDPADLQIVYGAGGERRLAETTLQWLPGYEQSAPVRIGNAAVEQLQLDVYGEVLDAMQQARSAGLSPDEWGWRLEQALIGFLESSWQKADHGLWETRGPPQHFTHSKVMAWVAFDRAIKAVEHFKLDGPAPRWRAIRQQIHDEICEKGLDKTRSYFTRRYGSNELDASLLMIPLVGFLPPSDPRVQSTIGAIERELVVDGFVLRYRTERANEVIPPGEGVFLVCSFWLADNYAISGRMAEAKALFERLLALQNDVGLLSEEYDPKASRFLGNFPQALSHVGLVNTALNLTPRAPKPAMERHRVHGGSKNGAR